MAEATEENTKSVENKMLEDSSAEDTAVSSDTKENHDQVDINKPSTSKASSNIVEKEETENTDLSSSEVQKDASKTDCNGDLKEDADLDKSVSLKSNNSETQESNSEEHNSTNTEPSEEEHPSEQVHPSEQIWSSEEDKTTKKSLNEIFKIVHEDLALEIPQSDSKVAIAKDDVGESNEKEQQTVKKESDSSTDDTTSNSNSITLVKNKRDSTRSSSPVFLSDSFGILHSPIAIEESVEEQLARNSALLVDLVDVHKTINSNNTTLVKNKKDSTRSSEISESFGIVHSPTAIDELVEEQLARNSALPTDRVDTHIVEWVKNTGGNSNDEDNIVEECKEICEEGTTQNVAKKRKRLSITPPFASSRKSKKIVSSIIKRSIKCLNKMHAMEGAAESKRKVNTAEEDKTSRSSPSPKVPQSQQNGAALPEETAAAATASVDRARAKKKDESHCDTEAPKSRQLLASTSRQSATTPSDVVVQPRHIKAGSEPVEIRKRKSTNGQLTSLGNPRKKFRDNYTREEYISRIVGDNNESIEDLIAKAEQLRADILALENLAHAKEMEWNEILRKRKLKEEAYLRLERKIQTTAYMENDGQLPETLPPARSSLGLTEWENNGNTVSKERALGIKEDPNEKSLDLSSLKKEKTTRASSQQPATPPKTNGESSRKQNEASSPESRQIGEGRQGAIVDVRAIIADHRLKHPETVPRRGRRMRNSNVNINLGAGGAMVETGHNADSRPSSTESCKSNPSANDSMNYKEMLVQFAKLSQQGGEAVKPQNYPDVTLHPVTPTSQNTSQPTGSLLHGILTKAQTPRSTTFSPTLARLLTAPERERSSPAAAAAAAAASASMSQQNATTQHLLQTYQGSNLVSINDLLSSSKARTEITITPVVNTSAQSHSNDLIQVEDVEEETAVIEERKGNSVVGRDSKQAVKDSPPSPNAPPKCQGCIIRPAQFVCAGCGNQWYCSRSCQLAAWATHSDHCPPEPENSKGKSNV